MAKLLALPDDVRAVQIAEFWAESSAVTSPHMAWPAPRPTLGQIMPKLHLLAVARIGKAVDRLVADPRRASLEVQPAGDLLWRPAMLDPLDDRRSQARETRQLAISATALLDLAVGGDTEVAGQIRHLRVLEDIPAQLTENRRTMPAEFLGNHIDTDPGLTPAGDLAPLIEINLRVGAFHLRFLACDNLLVSLQSRTSR